MLRHDMLDGIGSFIEMSVYVLIFVDAVVFKTFQDISFVLDVHQINLTGAHRLREFVIAREAASFRLGEKSILEFLQIVRCGPVKPNDFPVEHEKDLV